MSVFGESGETNACGIVAEYNPFHEGHAYHIRKSRTRAQVDAIIAIISSNFVQRGAPAMLDKRARTEAALSSGVDLALELPVVYSCHNAGLFANAAVDILAATGVVKKICFGMETPDDEALQKIADILIEEPVAFREGLKKFLAEGFSFVQARSMALDALIPGTAELLGTPNNNLALAYVQRIREKKYGIEPVAIERVGAGYHDKKYEISIARSREQCSLAGCGAEPHAPKIASATAIRALVADGQIREARRFMPEAAYETLEKNFDEGHTAHDADALWRMVKAAIVRGGTAELACVAEMREGLENRIWDAALRAASFDELVDRCTSRRYPTGRVQRHCMHLLLGLTHDESRAFQARGPAYIRVLGANERGRALLRIMRKRATLPVIARPSAPWSDYAANMMGYEHRATELWELLTKKPRLRAEAQFVPVLTSENQL